MNAYEQLVAIRDQLEETGASEESIALVEKFITRAESERNSDMSVTQTAMIRHLLRQRDALDSHGIYDDLQVLLSEIDARRASRSDDAARPAWEEERQPRPKSYYKAQKSRDGQQK